MINSLVVLIIKINSFTIQLKVLLLLLVNIKNQFLTFPTGIISITNHRRRSIGTVGGNETWAIYSDVPIIFNRQTNQLTASLPYTGFIKIIFINQGFTSWDHLDTLYQVHVIGGQRDYSINLNNAVIKFTWKIIGNGKSLMCALTHHINTLISSEYFNGLTYHYLTRPMKTIIRDILIMTEKLTEIKFIVPRSIPNQFKSDLITSKLQWYYSYS